MGHLYHIFPQDLGIIVEGGMEKIIRALVVDTCRNILSQRYQIFYYELTTAMTMV